MDKKFEQTALSAEDLANKLNGCSPLQASKVLIDTELFEQKSSLDVLNEIYDHFESKDSLIDELVTPIGLNVLDGIISHKKLKLNRTGITASRIWNEIKGFDYSTAGINASSLSNKQQLEWWLRLFADYDRKSQTSQHNLKKSKDEHFGDDAKANSSIEKKENGDPVELYRSQKDAESAGEKNLASDTDHVVPVKQLSDRFAKNALLTEKDIANITDADYNLIEISSELNRMKGAGSFKDLHDKKKKLQEKNDSGEKLTSQERKDLEKLEGISDETLENGIEAEEKASEKALEQAQDCAVENIKNNKAAIVKKAGGQALEQGAYQLLGTAVIETIKPIFYELSDSIQNGFEKGVEAKSLSEAIKRRFSRIWYYLCQVILPTLKGAVKDFFQNFSKILIEGVLGLVTGIFKNVLKILSEGFSAIISSVKILCSDSEEMSAAQKGDAIVKLLASTISTFVVFYFSETITKLIPDPFDEVVVAIASGIASTLVVYLIDKIDLFSLKDERRSELVAEIFKERIEQIKKNTDAFNAASVEILAKQKLAFNKLYQDFESGINNDFDVVNDVNKIADFMNIDVKVKDTESFLDMLQREKLLVI